MRCVLLPKLVKDGILLHRSESKLKLNLFTKYAVLDGADERQTMIEWSEITKDRIETEILLFKTLMNDESLVDQAENVHRATPIFCDSERDFCDLLNGDLALHTVALGSNTKKRQEVRRLIHERYLQVPTFVNRARPVSIAHEHAVMIDLIRKKDLEKLKKYLAKHLRTCFADLAKSPSFEAALREGMKSISVDA